MHARPGPLDTAAPAGGLAASQPSTRSRHRGQAWSAAAGAAAMVAIELAVHDVVLDQAGPDSQALFWTLALLTATPMLLAARFMPAPTMVGVGMVGGALLMLGLVLADVLWAVPAACAERGAFCEGVGLDRIVVIVAPGMWGVPALVAGWAWRHVARR